MAHRRLPIFRRRLFTALSVLSLLLCLATQFIWIRSYWIGDFIFESKWQNQTWVQHQLRIGNGGISFVHTRSPMSAGAAERNPTFFTPLVHRRLTPSYPSPLHEQAGVLGFYFRHVRPARESRELIILTPLWAVALLAAVSPTIWYWRFARRRRRIRQRLCLHCGYDLRATPERCPECGTERVLATDAHR